jgi:hypothetical protein
MNIECPTSNVEWGKMKKQAYDQEERLLEYTEIDVKCSVLDICFSFDVGRSFFKTIPYGI